MSGPRGMMFWPDAYLRDTQHLTATEHGVYFLILMGMWNNGGYLPDDDRRLAKVGKVSMQLWAKIGPTIREFLTVNKNGITQDRLLREMEKAKSVILRKQLSGKIGGLAKAMKYKERPLAYASSSPWQTHSIRNREDKKEAIEGGQAPAERGVLRLSDAALTGVKNKSWG